MTDLPVVSVVIPCYNQSAYLVDALESVLSQTIGNWECIIVDDGSMDDTRKVALNYVNNDNRFKYVSKENGGLSSARNAGIKTACGEFILPLDADDIIGDRYLEKSLAAFDQYPDLSVAYCKAEKFGIENGEWLLPKYDYRTLLWTNCIFCSAVFRKKLWEDYLGYDESFRNGWEDWAFWIKVLDPHSKVYQIPEVLFSYRVKENSMVKSIKDEQTERMKWQLFQSNITKYQTAFCSPLSLVEENDRLNKRVSELLRSNSYKIGNLLLTPLSAAKSWLKRKSR